MARTAAKIKRSQIKALKEAIEILGGNQSEVARLCNRHRSTVSYWLNGRAHIPTDCAKLLSDKSGVELERLRPDVYG